MIRDWTQRKTSGNVNKLENEYGPATCRGNFIGQNNTDPAANGETIFTEPNNLPTALATILNHAQNLADFHPAFQSPDHLSGRLASYLTEISKIPFFKNDFHDSVHREFNHGDINALIAELLQLYSDFSPEERNDMAIAISEMGRSVFGNGENAHSFMNLFATMTINANDPNNTRILLYYTNLEMHKFKDGKDTVAKQSFTVWRHQFNVSQDKIREHAHDLAILTKKLVEEWIEGVTSKEESGRKSCYSLSKIKDLLNTGMQEVPVVFIMNLPYPFVLSGKTDELWSKVSNNKWNKMLSKHWIDKGFHFYERIRNRGPEAGINTPSDLESAIRSGTVSRVINQRFRIVIPIVNSKGEHFTVFYDYNKSKSICELVTCSYE